MSKSAEQLIMALTKEYEMYRDYLDVAKKKKEVIINGQVKELESITNIEQSMIVSMGKIDTIRNSIIGNLLAELKIDTVDSLSGLVKYLPEKYQGAVSELRDKLEKVVGEIKNINDLNGALIQQSLDYIDFNMNLMMNMEAKGSTYGNNADEKGIKHKNLFDVKI